MVKNLDKKEYARLVEKLGKLGLSEKESAVYLYLLGRSAEIGTSKIINTTKLHGQYVYQALASLEERGLAKHVIKNGRKKFSANPPKRLEILAEEKHVIANELQDILEQKFARSHEQEFEIYQGQDQFVAHEFKLIEEAETGDFIDIIGGPGTRFSELMESDRRAYNDKAIEKKILVRFIGSEDQYAYLHKVKMDRPYFDFRIMPGLMETIVSTSIRPKSVTFQVYGDPVLTFSLKSSGVAASYHVFFEALWALSLPEETWQAK